MEIKFNVTGMERKALVEAVSQHTGCTPVYMKAPTFAYVVHHYTIDKIGTLVFDGRAEDEDTRCLLEGLAERGFVSDDTFDAEALAVDIPDSLSINVPLEEFTETALDNLKKLVASKAALIRKAIGLNQSDEAGTLPIMCKAGKLFFPWFTPGASPGEIRAYTQFVALLCDTAKKQTRVTAQENAAKRPHMLPKTPERPRMRLALKQAHTPPAVRSRRTV